jgi:hypothetical protein
VEATPSPLVQASSLEFIATVSLRGIAPAHAVIEELTATECRFRTVVHFDVGAPVDLAIDLPAAPRKAVARGTVLSRKSSSPRFLYSIRLDRMPTDDARDLARTIEDEIRSRSEEAARSAIAAIPTTERLVRNTVRVTTDFPMLYRTPKSDLKMAHAADVSANGLLMMCTDALNDGEPLELRFTLPSDVLAIYPEETVTLDVRTAAVRSSDSDARRPFKEMVAGARIISQHPKGSGLYAYGVNFTSIGESELEEIARFTEAIERASRAAPASKL